MRDMHLRTLGLQTDATAKEIRRAFRRLVLDLHPDRGGDAARLRAVLDAYEALLGTPRPVRRRRAPVRAREVVLAGPFVCPDCRESFGAEGECPRCLVAVAPLGARVDPPVRTDVDAMLADLEARRPSPWVERLAPRVPAAAIASLLGGGALALSIHGPVAAMLVGYGLLLFAGESFTRS
jgi:hypothetical protein